MYNLTNFIPKARTSIKNETKIIFTVLTVLLHMTRLPLLGSLNVSFIANIDVNILHQCDITYVGLYLLA